MMRSLFAGVSGLRNHQVRMDVIGNNIANVNTVAFKASRVTFEEAFAQLVQGASRPPGRADEDGVLLALFHAGIVGPGAIRGRDAAVVFLDAAADLAVNRLGQRGFRLFELGCEIGILGLEIGTDIGR